MKRYESGAQAWVRRIVKPVAGTVRVALGGVEQASGWSVNTTTGLVTFDTAPRRRRRHRRLRVRRAGALRHRPARRHLGPRPARLDRLDPARGGPAMNDDTGFVAGVLRDLAASTAAILAAWGALGGATNALTTRCGCAMPSATSCSAASSPPAWAASRWRSSPTGSKLPPEAVPAGGAAGSAAYLVGVFGPAVIEVTLARIRSFRSGEGPDA